MDEDEFRRALGDELRQYRVARGWTRAQLVKQMSQPVSTRALESYASGRREISVFRLVQLCTVLEIDPNLPLRAVTGRPVSDLKDLWIDLRTLVRDQSEDLLPLRRWGHLQLARLPADAVSTVHLAPNAVPPLADLCGLAADTLRRRIADVATPLRRWW